MDEKIMLAHGSGGEMSRRLTEGLFLKHFGNPLLNQLDDSAELEASSRRLAFTTDGYVVSPVVFPGGDIGKLSVCGTVNDLSAKGATPKWLSAAFILEEGLEISLLERITASMRKAADEAGVVIATGDTKVVDRGKADKIFIATSGVGEIPEGVNISCSGARPGDAVIITGRLGAHGVAVLNARHRLGLQSAIESDCAPLSKVAAAARFDAHAMRDLTRGGLAAALNEIAQSSGCAIEMDGAAIPVAPEVEAACGILGLDPLYAANEGALAVFTPREKAEKVLSAIRAEKYGANAVIAGKAVAGAPGVILKTKTGGRRALRMPEGEQLPRIC
ncbi:MAG: hydrogenase expression/formation protein HypE [Elusimicrobiales bacterium]